MMMLDKEEWTEDGDQTKSKEDDAGESSQWQLEKEMSWWGLWWSSEGTSLKSRGGDNTGVGETGVWMKESRKKIQENAYW